MFDPTRKKMKKKKETSYSEAQTLLQNMEKNVFLLH